MTERTATSRCDVRPPARPLTRPRPQHAVLVDLPSGRRAPLTLGTFTVTRVLAWHSARRTLYYTATPLGAAHRQEVYSVRSGEGAGLGAPSCLSCGFVNCSWAEAAVSPG